ncbi:MAG: tRNA (adenosine(37)-N6)-threonylcarbamoyltransferase complex dimerization subunit type 1 TsaB [Gammaproteobacteria bacterium]|nr:tRNA (adenosine(37)-N6)-threonylcarbamoyltransferase complex dimerization subunit type 1 TsaB [Gammaproteobacteria bacterium]
MTGILAIDTATEACSVAVYVNGEYRELYEVVPRRHSQRLFGMLQSLLPDGRLREHGIDAIAYSSGPGSFTGLRIAASAVQGLAYTSGLPAIAVSTLALQAQTALRLGLVDTGMTVLSMLDARINEVYYAVCAFDELLATVREGPCACPPSGVAVAASANALHGVGSGCRFAGELPAAVSSRLESLAPDLLPSARDLVPLALASLARGEVQRPQQVQPVYVRDEINWKKLAEQGKKL